MSVLRAIGLMSGTSMDGIDVAAIATDGETVVERGPSDFVPYESVFRARIAASLEVAKSIVKREERPGDLAALERDITMRHGAAVAAFLAKVAAAWRMPDVIGFHGQTILHRPERALTVQLGDGALLAREIGVDVIYDMRADDMAANGQGAPLAPAYHTALARSLPSPQSGNFPMVFVNIGGISNVTFVPATGDPVAFDSGPGNALIDQWVAREAGVPFDADGAIASEGRLSRAVIDRYIDAPFFTKSGPKSLDRNDFTLNHVEGMDLADGARTLAAISAEAILKSAEHMPGPPKLWIICGGGRKNPHIFNYLRNAARARNSDVVLAEDVGLNGDSMEAEAWAHLAVRSVKRLPLTFPTTTGCREPVTGGARARAQNPPPSQS